MKETLRIINRMQRDGVIGKYAIGRAVGASVYLEPFTTKDLDVFVRLPVLRGSKLISLAGIYEYLRGHGGEPRGQFVVIADWAVEFLHPTTDLELEALAKAVRIRIEGVATWVMTAEHLAAICLQTGRTKDRYRIISFLEQRAVNLPKLRRLVARYGLIKQWEQFERTDFTRDTNPRSGSKAERRHTLRRLPLKKKIRVIEDLRNAGLSLRKARRTLR